MICMIDLHDARFDTWMLRQGIKPFSYLANIMLYSVRLFPASKSVESPKKDL
eukprot:COSAG06_NODE_1328_length_9852_cov_590.986158_7_plen_52_part_00